MITMTEDRKKEATRARSKRPEGSLKLLPGSAAAFGHLAAAVQVVAEAAPARMSIRQVLAFTIVAYANAMGRRITLSEVRELAGDALGQGIERSIAGFFAPTKREPDALGWLEQEPDEDDRRKKYLVLTERGRYVVNEITRALTSVH